ncbi:EamA family transporter [Flavobacterium sp. xlx-214]|uniref:EamA family transporter n=1 Tax=unclassified Flavobacterium TaxID=196869 RepID=UPI0013D4A650|nr:EamA family transporter [Flavobacterium sp. xlx-221]QMI83057.1 EamA family transporter [Flavobacterium sp. xlx-214]
MYALIISLISSLCVGFYIKTLKIASSKNLFLLVIFNYIVAVILSYIFFDISLNEIVSSKINIGLVLFLGILMPSAFYILNKSLKTSGLAKTDIFQRLSLIIPVLLSFFIFNEVFSINKAIIILLSFISICFLLYKKSTNNGKFNIIYLILVFLIYGLIDTLFKIIATSSSTKYTTTLFFIFICCTVVSLLYYFFNKGKSDLKFIYLGALLGILNFCNIFFYMKAHTYFKDSPTLVFITMNLGVIIGGTLIGKYYFKEKISKPNVIGILLAVASIILLALVQLNIL